MGYIHYEVKTKQIPKSGKIISGDIVEIIRTDNSTIVILCDGMGSGIKAHTSAKFYIERLKSLLNFGYTVRQAFLKVVKNIVDGKSNDYPFAAITLLRILNNGSSTLLSYESPEPVFISNLFSSPISNYTILDYNIRECNFKINRKDYIVLISDGISEAGIDKRGCNGISVDGLCKILNSKLSNNNIKYKEIEEIIFKAALTYWEGNPKDDLSSIIIYPRNGLAVNILTGPSSEESSDYKVVNDFLAKDGIKIICGATTAKIVARITGKRLFVDDSLANNVTPPYYELEGIDLVTEGAVTLNQLYNIYDIDNAKIDKFNTLNELKDYIKSADKIDFTVGRALNLANNDITFKQLGILSRNQIIPLLREKLIKDDKLVKVNYV